MADKNKVDFPIEYYQPAFMLLNQLYAKRVGPESMLEARNYQTSSLVNELGKNKTPTPDETWNTGRKLLDEIESKIKVILERHSVFYWLHLYRRTGCYLNRFKGEQQDETTVGLVREILELAIQKYGSISNSSDFGSIKEHPLENVLGGWMEKGASFFKQEIPNFDKDDFLHFQKSFDQLVLLNFNEKDYIDVFRAQAYAYEFWKITALLRATGKGASIVVKNENEWSNQWDSDFGWLVESFDQRNIKYGTSASNLGYWAFSKEREVPDFNGDLILPRINLEQKISEEFGIVTNFRLGVYPYNYSLTLNEPLLKKLRRNWAFLLMIFFRLFGD